MSTISQFIRNQVQQGGKKYNVSMFEELGSRSDFKNEDQDVFCKQAKKNKKVDFSSNRKAKRGEL